MYPYTKNNHFRFGYVGGPDFAPRQNSDEVFRAQYGARQNAISSWPEANIQAAKEIFDQKVGDIFILFSGGMDSEICIRSFLEAKVPFKTITTRYTNGSNQNELHYVEELKRQFNFPHEYLDLDVEAFWESQKLYDYVDPIKCVSPILACHLWLADQVSGTPVIAQGEAQLRKQIPKDYIPGVSPYNPSPWDLVESEMFCSLYTHFIYKNKPAVPGFFQFLPEQTYAFLFHNLYLNRLINNEIVGKLSTRSSKNSMSLQYYPTLMPREKYTGFESIDEAHLRKRKQLAERFPFSESVVLFSMNEMRAMLASSKG